MESFAFNLSIKKNCILWFLFQDGVHKTQTNFEVRVKDIQDKPPVFLEYKSNVIDEDSPINTLVLKIQARDGDTGEPRKIVYDLLTSEKIILNLIGNLFS